MILKIQKVPTTFTLDRKRQPPVRGGIYFNPSEAFQVNGLCVVTYFV